MSDKRIKLDGVDILKEKINMCFILLINKLETSETIERTIYEHLDAFVEEWNKQLVSKEQECEELKKIINEAKNSKLDLKSFLVGEAVQNEYEQQINQLKAENKELKKCYKNNSALLDFEETNTTKLVNKVMKLEKTLTEIKEIAQYDVYTLHTDLCIKLNWVKKKISEVENE